MIVLIGKSGSGKDTVKKILIERYSLESVLEYTTRPIRKNEVEGINYHYISEKDFFKKTERNEFAAWTCFDTVQGIWYYGSLLKDYKDYKENGLLITNPSILKCLVNRFDYEKLKIKVFYLDVDEYVLYERLKQRGDDEKEAERRIIADREDFDLRKIHVDFKINCNNKTAEQIAKEIFDLDIRK